MCVDDNAFLFSKGVSQNHIRRFPSNTRQPMQFIHRIWHPPIMLRYNRSRRATDATSFAAKETGGPNQLLQSRGRRLRVIPSGPILGEKCRRNLIHPDISTLGRQNGGYQEFQWTLKIEFAPRLWINLRQSFHQSINPFAY